MTKNDKIGFKQKIKFSKSSRRWLRSTCAVLCVLTLLFSFVGCDSYATAEEMASLTSNFEDDLEELEALKKSQTSSQTELDSFKESNTALKEELESLKNSHTAANQKIDRLEADIIAAKTEINTLKSNYAEAQQKIDALLSDNEATLQEIEMLKEQIQELQSLIPPDDSEDKIKIYIDQGHNPTSYHNSGATGNDLYEENLTFTIGILLSELLEEDGRFDICLSRPTATTVLGTDNDTSLDARVQGAEDFGADYFISLHINAYESDTAHGIEVHVAEENSTSYAFGNQLLQGMINSTGLRNRGMKISPNLRVLKNTTMPAALLEMGFITNPEDANFLSQNQNLFAEGIYDGILSYFELEPIDPDPS